MSAYAGIDVYRRRSQIAVMDEGGRTAVNRNVRNGREALLEVIGGLPVGTPVALPQPWPLYCARICCRSAGSPHRRSAGSGWCCATVPNRCGCARCCATG